MAVILGILFITASPQSTRDSLIDKITGKKPTSDIIELIFFIEGKQKIIHLTKDKLLFNVDISYDKNQNPEYVNVSLKPELLDYYKQIGFSKPSDDTVFVYPLFTQAAYGNQGFYSYYNKKCGPECLTVPIPSKFVPTYASSVTSTIVLSLLNYTQITDVDVDKNPDILKKYNKVIILHNEYVTKKEFDAITNHPHVLYLFPNALYAEVKTDYKNNTISLVKGHGYPDSSILNGFNWKFDNTNLEYDINCDNMTFTKIPNGTMLNCYPAYRAIFDRSYLEAIKTS